MLASNSRDLLSDLDTTDHNFAPEFPFEETPGLKILGIVWNPSDDVLRFNVIEMTSEKITKKHMFSSVGKLFDPLGWLSPFVITAKILPIEFRKFKLLFLIPSGFMSNPKTILQILRLAVFQFPHCIVIISVGSGQNGSLKIQTLGQKLNLNSRFIKVNDKINVPLSSDDL